MTTCRAEGCPEKVSPVFIFCVHHWSIIPTEMKSDIWRTYTPGQEHLTKPTEAHLDAVSAAVKAVAAHEALKAPRLL